MRNGGDSGQQWEAWRTWRYVRTLDCLLYCLGDERSTDSSTCPSQPPHWILISLDGHNIVTLINSTPSYTKLDTGFDHLTSSPLPTDQIFLDFPCLSSALRPGAKSSNKRWLEKNVPSWHQVQSLIHLSQEPIRPASGLQNSINSMGWDPELYHPLALTLLLIKCCADFYYNLLATLFKMLKWKLDH